MQTNQVNRLLTDFSYFKNCLREAVQKQNLHVNYFQDAIKDLVQYQWVFENLNQNLDLVPENFVVEEDFKVLQTENTVFCAKSIWINQEQYYYGVVVLSTQSHKMCWIGLLLAQNWNWIHTLPYSLMSPWLNSLIGVSVKIKKSSYNETRIGHQVKGKLLGPGVSKRTIFGEQPT